MDGRTPASLPCPGCGRVYWRLIAIRHKRGRVWRRRECRSCTTRITTAERIVASVQKPKSVPPA